MPFQKGNLLHKRRRWGFRWDLLRFWQSKAWRELKEHLEGEFAQGHEIYPSPTNKLDFNVIFRPLSETPFHRVRIVILGQDPYPRKGEADGLAFSTSPSNKRIPGSLGNIFYEYQKDLGYKHPLNGSLAAWARNGILLINSVWTINPAFMSVNRSNSRALNKNHYRINGKYYWDELTYEILDELSKRKDKLVFILWGKKAQAYRHMIDEKKHLVIIGPHPSPRNWTSTSKDGLRFRGGKYFTKACEYLNINKTIWLLP